VAGSAWSRSVKSVSDTRPNSSTEIRGFPGARAVREREEDRISARAIWGGHGEMDVWLRLVSVSRDPLSSAGLISFKGHQRDDTSIVAAVSARTADSVENKEAAG